MNSLVYVHEVDEKTNYNQLFAEILDQNNMKFTENDLVLIKPNLGDLTSPSNGSTTDVTLVRYLIQEIQKQANCRIIIAESDHPISDADREFEILGYTELRDELGVELVNLSKDNKVEIFVDGHYFNTLCIGETSFKATKIINFPKLKTHGSQKITVCLKNLFGLLPQKFRGHLHSHLSEVLHDLDQIYHTDLCIVDGVVGMEGYGPSDGSAKEANLIISGTNNVCVDVVCSKIMGFNPNSAPNINYMLKLNSSLKDVRINFEKKLNKKYKRRFKFIPWYTYFFKILGKKFERFGTSISKTFDALGGFLAEAGTGLMVLFKGSFVSLGTGKLRRNDVFKYAVGLLRKPIKKLKFK